MNQWPLVIALSAVLLSQVVLVRNNVGNVVPVWNLPDSAPYVTVVSRSDYRIQCDCHCPRPPTRSRTQPSLVTSPVNTQPPSTAKSILN